MPDTGLGEDDRLVLIAGFGALVVGALLNWFIELFGICLFLFEGYRWARVVGREHMARVVAATIVLLAAASFLAVFIPSTSACCNLPWQFWDNTAFYWLTLIPLLYAGAIAIVFAGILAGTGRIGRGTRLLVLMNIVAGLSLYLFMLILKEEYLDFRAFYMVLALMVTPVIIWSVATEAANGKWARIGPDGRAGIVIMLGALTFLAELYVLVTTSWSMT